jgi:hypothetical protein
MSLEDLEPKIQNTIGANWLDVYGVVLAMQRALRSH